MRIAIVYDCLHPYVLGGAERWYASLAERLAVDHEITYVTRRQWDRRAAPRLPYEVVAVAPGGQLYDNRGRRRIWPPIRFGGGVFWHLLRHGRDYDAVHCASFPYFSLLGAWLALRLRRGRRLVVDWHEVWTQGYWIRYLGPIAGRLGYLVQRLCVKLPDHSFTFSRMYTRRLAAEGHKAPITRLTGEYSGNHAPAASDEDLETHEPETPNVVFAGRHIPEKRVTLVPDVIREVLRTIPALRCTIFGDGPEREQLERRVDELELRGAITVQGHVSADQVSEGLAQASCLLLPSLREGYGLVVVESIARGTPAVLVEGSDNAATELIEEGVNGLIAKSADPREIATRVLEVLASGRSLRNSTRDWYLDHAHELSIESSLAAVRRAYAADESSEGPAKALS